MRNPAVAALAADSRPLAIARRMLGAPATPFRATLFEKSGKANWLVAWHQDTALPLTSRFDAPEWGPWSLDASTSDNGPLRVNPGWCASGVLTDAQVLDYSRTQSPVECLVPRGGVLAMRPLLIHASSKVRDANPRRVLHIEYADSLELSPGVRLAIA